MEGTEVQDPPKKYSTDNPFAPKPTESVKYSADNPFAQAQQPQTTSPEAAVGYSGAGTSAVVPLQDAVGGAPISQIPSAEGMTPDQRAMLAPVEQARARQRDAATKVTGYDPVFLQRQQEVGSAQPYDFQNEEDPRRKRIVGDAINFAATDPTILPYSPEKMANLKAEGMWDNKKEASFQGAALTHAQDVIDGKKQILEQGLKDQTISPEHAKVLADDIEAQKQYLQVGWAAVHQIDPTTVQERINQKVQQQADVPPGPYDQNYGMKVLGRDALGLGTAIANIGVKPILMGLNAAYKKIFSEPDAVTPLDRSIEAIADATSQAEANIPTELKKSVIDQEGAHPARILNQLAMGAIQMAPFLALGGVGGVAGEGLGVGSKFGAGATIFGATYADEYDKFVRQAMDAGTPEHPVNEKTAEKYAHIPAALMATLWSINPNFDAAPLSNEVRANVIKAMKDGVAPKDALKSVLADATKGGASQAVIGNLATASEHVANNAINEASGTNLPTSQTASQLANATIGNMLLGGVLSLGHNDVVSGARAEAMKYAAENPDHVREIIQQNVAPDQQDKFMECLDRLAKVYKGNNLTSQDAATAATVATKVVQKQDIEAGIRENPADPIVVSAVGDPREEHKARLSSEIIEALDVSKKQALAAKVAEGIEDVPEGKKLNEEVDGKATLETKPESPTKSVGKTKTNGNTKATTPDTSAKPTTVGDAGGEVGAGGIQETVSPSADATTTTGDTIVENAQPKGAQQPVDNNAAGADGADAVGQSGQVPEQPTGQPEADAGPEPQGEQVKKTFATKRVYEGEFRDEVKAEIEKTGLYRKVENQVEAANRADAFIAKVGIDAAMDAVRNGDVRGGAESVIKVRKAEALDKEILAEQDPERRAELMREQAELVQETGQILTEHGQAGSMMNYLYQNSDLGFNSTAKADQFRRETGKEPSEETMRHWQDLDKQLSDAKAAQADAEKRAKAAEEQLLHTAIKNSVAREKRSNEIKNGGKYTAKGKAAAEAIRKLKSKPITFTDANGNVVDVRQMGFDFNGLIEVAAKIVEKSGEVADGLAHIVKKLNEQKKFKALSDDQKKAILSQVEDALKEAKADADKDVLDRVELVNGRLRIPKQMIRDAVEQGAKDIGELTSAIKDHIKEKFPDATEREVRDAITEYGKVLNMSKDRISIDIRKMKRVGKLISQLEDVANKKRPLRSGLQRDKLDAEERSLNKQLREAMKDLPVDAETHQREVKTALDAAKSRVKNRMEDMQREIETKQRLKKGDKGWVPDEELKALIAEKDALQAIHDDVFPDTAPTDEERTQRAVDAAQRSLDNYEKLLREKNFDPKKPVSAKESAELKALREKVADAKEKYQKAKDDAGFGKKPLTDEERLDRLIEATRRSQEEYERKVKDLELDPKKKSQPNSTELMGARERRDAAKAEYTKLQEEAGVFAKRSLETRKKAALKAEQELKRRISDGDFSKTEKKPAIVDNELTAAKARILRLREEYDKAYYKDKLQQRDRWEIAKDAAKEAPQLLRALNATLDFSFVGVQGLKMTVSNLYHNIGADQRAFKNMFKAIWSEKASEDWLHKIKSQDWYPKAKEAKLALTEPHAEITAREELFVSDWTRLLWNTPALALEKAGIIKRPLYERWAKANPIRAIERGAVAYLDTLRVERFLQGMEMLDTKKVSGEDITPQHYKDVAGLINTLTGRASLGKLEPVAKALTNTFYSPRLWASAIKTATPYGLYKWSLMTPTARKMAVHDMSRFVGTTMGIVALAAVRLNNDDDPDTKVETDPRSSDFGKIRLSKTMAVDPWGGMAQQVVFMSRFAIGAASLAKDKPYNAYKNSKGELLPLGLKDRSPTMSDVGVRMATNKLAPWTSFLWEAASSEVKKKGERNTSFGQPYNMGDAMLERITPMYAQTLRDVYKEDPNALGGFLAFYALFGGGVQTYDDQKAKKGGTNPMYNAQPSQPTMAQ